MLDVMVPSTLWRFPGPLALRAVLDGAPPTLHHLEARVAYLGDLSLWRWPGVSEFGALTVFAADGLAPQPTEIPGWYTVDLAAVGVALDARRVLFVPDERCAAAVEGAADAAAARRRLPADYDAAVGEVRQAMERYDALSQRVVDAWQTLGDDRVPDRWRETLDTPLHLLPRATRDALADGLQAALAGAPAR